MASSAPVTARPIGSGLRGGAVDLLLGAGAAYLLSVPLVLLAARGLGLEAWPFTVMWIITIGLSSPHYGATLLRVYERGEERRRYAFFSLWVTLGLAGLFVGGLRSAWLMAVLQTLYFTWSPWHFAGQNYGVALMFLRRSGVAVDPLTKRVFYASFLLSFLLAFVALHVEGSAAIYASTGTETTGPALMRLGIPLAWARVLMLAFGAAYLGCVATAALRLARVAEARVLLPVACLVVSQALWFAVPAAFDVAGTWSVRPLVFWAIWISAAHSLQYLWVTLQYAKRTDPSTRLGPYLVKTTLVGNAALVLPGLLALPSLLDGPSWNAGLAMLIFSVVNLHHFILDGAVWKLRDGRVARALLRQDPSDGELGATSPAPAARRSRWLAAGAWTVASACLLVSVCELGWRHAESLRAYRAAGLMLDVLGSIGREHDVARIRMGRRLTEQGHAAAARRQFERSLAVRPSVNAWGGLGRTYEMEGDARAALAAYRAALALEPDHAGLARRVQALDEALSP